MKYIKLFEAFKPHDPYELMIIPPNKKAEMMEKAKAEVETMISNGKKMLESEKNKMVEEAKAEIVSIVVKATEKLLETNDRDAFDEKTLNKIKKIK
jgi:F0F1-type ATP synthase membrane subunit b/b'